MSIRPRPPANTTLADHASVMPPPMGFELVADDLTVYPMPGTTRRAWANPVTARTLAVSVATVRRRRIDPLRGRGYARGPAFFTAGEANASNLLKFSRNIAASFFACASYAL